MEIVNLTPHPVRIVNERGEVVIPPSGVIARVSIRKEMVGEISIDGIRVPIYKVEYGEVEGLPEPSEGVVYIVSSVVASKVAGRSDVVVPDDFIRDASGNIIGAKGFSYIE